MKRYGTIYLVQNLTNGKSYVGQTTSSVKSRYYYHSKNKYSKSILSDAIRKYGLDNFKVTEIYTSFSKQDLDKAEIYFIKLYNSKVPEGYNIKSGGSAGKLPKHIVQRIANHNKGNSYRKGKFCTKTQKIEMAKKINKNYDKILCTNLETGKTKVYDTMTETNKDGFCFKKVSKCINQRRADGLLYTHKGHIFEYISQANQNGSLGSKVPKHVQRLDDETIKKMKYHQGKPVLATNLETGETKTYPNIASTSEDGFQPKSVSRVLNGKRKTYLKHSFVFIEYNSSTSQEVPTNAKVGI